MLYLSGMYSLNLPCGLETSGDWHTSSIDWKDLVFRESVGSVFGDYGIESGRHIPENHGEFNVADHIRALLDMISDGDLRDARGMKNDYICAPQYHEELFEKIILLRHRDNWDEVYDLMYREFGREWRIWINGK